MTDREERTKSATLGDLPVSTPPRLLVFWDGGALTYDLPVRGDLTIGRSKQCEICIDHPSVSRRHAVLHVGPELSVEDLGSHNGTRVGGARIGAGQRVRLRRGTLLEVGLCSVIALDVDATAAPTMAPAFAGATEMRTMDRVRQLLDLVAPSRMSIVLLGETGVGKEVTARIIHERSDRRTAPFMAVNCAALPENLLESELFGYERGAFTGALQSKPGLMEAVDGGTLFLDEVAELPLSIQAKLLRVLELREVSRLGSFKPKTVDVRFVSATNADLEAMIAEKTFRRDLFYRLNGMTITIPPLRERRSEILPLALQFVQEACGASGAQPPVITPAALAELAARSWPGNVRELRNVMERAVVLSRGGPIEVQHLVTEAVGSAAPGPEFTAERTPESRTPHLRADVEALEKRRIMEALEKSAGNQTAAAKHLGISRRTLIGRLDAYGLPRPRKV